MRNVAFKQIQRLPAACSNLHARIHIVHEAGPLTQFLHEIDTVSVIGGHRF